MRCGNAVCIYASVTRDVADLVHVFIEKQGKQKKSLQDCDFFLLFLSGCLTFGENRNRLIERA
mgnify:CR=1 FL=1